MSRSVDNLAEAKQKGKKKKSMAFFHPTPTTLCTVASIPILLYFNSCIWSGGDSDDVVDREMQLGQNKNCIQNMINHYFPLPCYFCLP